MVRFPSSGQRKNSLKIHSTAVLWHLVKSVYAAIVAFSLVDAPELLHRAVVDALAGAGHALGHPCRCETADAHLNLPRPHDQRFQTPGRCRLETKKKGRDHLLAVSAFLFFSALST